MKTLYLILILPVILTLHSYQSNIDKSNIFMLQVNDQKTNYLVNGIDISKFQNNEISSFSILHDSLDFIICKATEGMTYTDPKFKQNWKMIKENHFIRGAYHFYRSDDDPLAQAAFFLDAIFDIQNTDLPPIIDFEELSIDKSQSTERIQSRLLIFLNEIKIKSKRKPIIYTDINTGNKYLNKLDFSDYPLWVADYNGKSKPNLPIAWKSSGWLIWQRSDEYKINNITNDSDVFNGSIEDLKGFIKNGNLKN